MAANSGHEPCVRSYRTVHRALRATLRCSTTATDRHILDSVVTAPRGSTEWIESLECRALSRCCIVLRHGQGEELESAWLAAIRECTRVIEWDPSRPVAHFGRAFLYALSAVRRRRCGQPVAIPLSEARRDLAHPWNRPALRDAAESLRGFLLRAEEGASDALPTPQELYALWEQGVLAGPMSSPGPSSPHSPSA